MNNQEGLHKDGEQTLFKLKSQTDLCSQSLFKHDPAELHSHLTKPPSKAEPLICVISTKRGHPTVFSLIKCRSDLKLSTLVLVERFGRAQHFKIKDWPEYQCDHQRRLSVGTCADLGLTENLIVVVSVQISVQKGEVKTFFLAAQYLPCVGLS